MASEEYKSLFDGINSIVLNADRPSAFLECICHYLGAKAGSIWSNGDSSLSKEYFVLRAVCNRPEAIGMINKQTFHISRDYTVAADAFRTHSPITGKVGIAPFDETWMSQKHTADLRRLGITHVAIIPVSSFAGEPTNVLSLYFAKDVSIVNQAFLGGVGQLFTSINEALNKRLKKHRQERIKDRHEVLSHASVIRAHSEALDKLLAQEIDSSSKKGMIIRKKISDIRRSVGVLIKVSDGVPFRERVEKGYDDAIYHDVVPFLSDSLQAAARKYSSRNVGAGNVACPDECDCALLFGSEYLTMLFSNIYDNAFKYSVNGSVVRTRLRKYGMGIQVEIRNDVAIDIDDDLETLWEYDVRGSSSFGSNIPGQGIGLGLVRDICDVYDVDARMHFEERATKVHTKVFCIVLKFPEELVDRHSRNK